MHHYRKSPMSTTTSGTLSVRLQSENPNHHLYRNNGGNWWIHYTLHFSNNTVERIRLSLGTRNLAEARGRRDATFNSLAQMEVST